MKWTRTLFCISAFIWLVCLLSFCTTAYGQENQDAITALNAGLFFPDIGGATNPTVTQFNIQQTICLKGWTATIRPPVSYTNPLKKKLMAQAGIPWSQAKSYELDHHVPLEAGGNPSSLQNLALQSYIAKPWNAHLKDKLENFIHRQICNGHLTLAQGEAVFMTPDWRTQYCKWLKDAACGGLPK